MEPTTEGVFLTLSQQAFQCHFLCFYLCKRFAFFCCCKSHIDWFFSIDEPVRSHRLLIFSVPSPPQNLGDAHPPSVTEGVALLREQPPLHATLLQLGLHLCFWPHPLPSVILVGKSARAHTQAYSDVMSSNLVETMPTQWKPKYTIALIHLLKNWFFCYRKSNLKHSSSGKSTLVIITFLLHKGSSHNFTLSFCCRETPLICLESGE